MKRIVLIGSGPEAVKLTPLLRILKAGSRPEVTLLHGRDGRDLPLVGEYFRGLGPQPDLVLDGASESAVQRVSGALLEIKDVVERLRPGLVVTHGDSDVALSTAIVCAKLEVPLMHLDSGLRSHDISSPDELNRILIDHSSRLCIAPSDDANFNLLREGIHPDRISVAGDLMVDACAEHVALARGSSKLSEKVELKEGEPLILVMLGSVLEAGPESRVLGLMEGLSSFGQCRILIPMKAESRVKMEEVGVLKAVRSSTNITLLDPLEYLDYLALLYRSSLAVTDSRMVVEQAACLKVPCLTLGRSMERPETVRAGINMLIGEDPSRVRDHLGRILYDISFSSFVRSRPNPLGSPGASRRMAGVLTGSMPK